MSMLVRKEEQNDPPESEIALSKKRPYRKLKTSQSKLSSVFSSPDVKPLVDSPSQQSGAVVISLDEERAKALADYNKRIRDDTKAYKAWIQAYAGLPERLDLKRKAKSLKYDKTGTTIIGTKVVTINKPQVCWLLEGDRWGDPESRRHQTEEGYPTREKYERASDDSTYVRRKNGLQVHENYISENWVQREVTVGFEHLRRPPTLNQIWEKYWLDLRAGRLSSPTPEDLDIEFFISDDDDILAGDPSITNLFDLISFDTYEARFEDLVRLGLVSEVGPSSDVFETDDPKLPFQNSAAYVSSSVNYANIVSVEDEIAATRRLGCGRRQPYDLAKLFYSRGVHVGHDTKSKWKFFYSSYREKEKANRLSAVLENTGTDDASRVYDAQMLEDVTLSFFDPPEYSPLNDDCIEPADFLKAEQSANITAVGATSEWVFDSSELAFYALWLYRREEANVKAFEQRAIDDEVTRERQDQWYSELCSRLVFESLPNVVARQFDFVNAEWYNKLPDEERYRRYWSLLSIGTDASGLQHRMFERVVHNAVARVKAKLSVKKENTTPTVDQVKSNIDFWTYMLKCNRITPEAYECYVGRAKRFVETSEKESKGYVTNHVEHKTTPYFLADSFTSLFTANKEGILLPPNVEKGIYERTPSGLLVPFGLAQLVEPVINKPKGFLGKLVDKLTS